MILKCPNAGTLFQAVVSAIFLSSAKVVPSFGLTAKALEAPVCNFPSASISLTQIVTAIQ